MRQTKRNPYATNEARAPHLNMSIAAINQNLGKRVAKINVRSDIENAPCHCHLCAGKPFRKIKDEDQNLGTHDKKGVFIKKSRFKRWTRNPETPGRGATESSRELVK